MNKIFKDIVTLEIEKMIKESEYIDPLSHNGVKGTIRELGLSTLISKFLPNHLKVGSGQIHDSKGNQSNETDLLIYDTNVLPAILFDEYMGIFPIESVVCDFEIKTTSTSKEIQTTIDKFKNFHNLNLTSDKRCPSVYFAYKTDLKNKSELERYFSLDDQFNTNPTIMVLCVVNEGYYFYDIKNVKFEPTSNNNQEYKENGCYLCSWRGIKFNINSDEKHSEVIHFLAGLLNTIREYKFGEYLLNDGNFDIFYQVIYDKYGNIKYEKTDFNGIKADENLEKILPNMKILEN